jgi:hypothetical protein
MLWSNLDLPWLQKKSWNIEGLLVLYRGSGAAAAGAINGGLKERHAPSYFKI